MEHILPGHVQLYYPSLDVWVNLVDLLYEFLCKLVLLVFYLLLAEVLI